MKIFRNLRQKPKLWIQKFRTELIWSLLLTIGITIVSSIFSIRNLSGLEADVNAMYEADSSGQNHLGTSTILILSMDNEIKSVLLNNTRREIGALLNNMDRMKTRLSESVAAAAAAFRDPSSEQVVTFTADFQAYRAALEGVMQEFSIGVKPTQAEMDRFETVERALSAAIRTLNSLKQKENITTFSEVSGQLHFSLAVSIISLAGTMAFRIFSHRRKIKMQKANPCP